MDIMTSLSVCAYCCANATPEHACRTNKDVFELYKQVRAVCLSDRRCVGEGKKERQNDGILMCGKFEKVQVGKFGKSQVHRRKLRIRKTPPARKPSPAAPQNAGHGAACASPPLRPSALTHIDTHQLPHRRTPATSTHRAIARSPTGTLHTRLCRILNLRQAVGVPGCPPLFYRAL